MSSSQAFFFLLVNHVSGDERATAFSSILIVAATLMAVYGLTQSMVEGTAFRVHGTMSIYMTFAGILMLSALTVTAQILFLPCGPWFWGLGRLAGVVDRCSGDDAHPRCLDWLCGRGCTHPGVPTKAFFSWPCQW